MGKPTAIVSDWSCNGIGYVLLQKKCKCLGMSVSCCKSGWNLLNMGSRFLTPTESRYSAIEGELLGVIWALSKTKFWTLGNLDVTIFTDHKPLLGLFRNKEFDEIGNPRLLRLIEKSMRWSFKVWSSQL